MPSRHLKCSCLTCGAVWRMAKKWIARAQPLMCPVCGSDWARHPAVEPNPPVTDEERATIASVCERVAERAAREINAGRVHAREGGV